MAEAHGTLDSQPSDGQKIRNSSWVSLQVSEDDGSKPAYSLCKKCSRAVKYSQEFCQKTSLHGLQYLGENERPLPERACWMVVILISIMCCFMVIMKQWTKWQTSPVIITFAETSTPAWNIPFPAVTICSEMQFKQSTFNYSEILMKYLFGNSTEDENRKLFYTHLLCDDRVWLYDRVNGSVDEGLYEHLLNIAIPVDELMKRCTWRGINDTCSEFFAVRLTDGGVCYTFNSVANSELFADDVVQAGIDDTPPTTHWSLETGYNLNKNDENAYPYRTMSAGFESGMSVYLVTHAFENDFMCRFPLEGFKMMLHNPVVFPEVKKNFFRVPSHRDVVIGVHPKIIRTTKELQNYSPKLRQCLFERERKLRFFKIYTQENCEMECLTNYTLEYCNCAKHYMPRTKGTSICGPEDAKCNSELQVIYNFDTEYQDICNCLPGCMEIKYDVEISESGYILEQAFYYRDMMDKQRLGSFNVFLKDMQVITRKRSELYGASDFLANCGGLLGLFLGFSILSLVEIFYFISVRLFYNVRHYRRQLSK